MDKINTDVFKYDPIIDIPNLELYIHTNPIHGDSGIENMDISLDDAGRYDDFETCLFEGIKEAVKILKEE